MKASSDRSPPPLERGPADTVLVVEDDESIGRLLEFVLGMNKMRVLWARTGAEALKGMAEQRSRIRLVLADHGPPDMAGDEVCRRLRSESPSLPVILASGLGQQEAADRLGGCGPTRFLQKPYSPKEVVDCIVALLDPPVAAAI